MGSQPLPPIIDFARVRRDRDDDQGFDDVGPLARLLGETVANAADADQWTVVVDEVDHGGYTFPLPPRRLLRVLNRGRRATHEVTLPLRAGARELGTVRLVTIRPQGFSDSHLEQARAAIECAGRLLALALDRAAQSGCHWAAPPRLAPPFRLLAHPSASRSPRWRAS